MASFFTGTQPTYTQADVALTAYVGQPTVYLRFRLTTDSSVVYDGWVMDDLALKDGATTLFSDDFELGTLAWVLDSPWAAPIGGASQAIVQASLNGSTWTNLADYQGTLASYSQVSLNLSAYLGQPSVRFRWRVSVHNTAESVRQLVRWTMFAVDVSGSTVFSDDFESGTSTTGHWMLRGGEPCRTRWPMSTQTAPEYRPCPTIIEELRDRSAIPDYDVIDENNLNNFWANLNQYHTIVMEEDAVYEYVRSLHPSCAADPGHDGGPLALQSPSATWGLESKAAAVCLSRTRTTSQVPRRCH